MVRQPQEQDEAADSSAVGRSRRHARSVVVRLFVVVVVFGAVGGGIWGLTMATERPESPTTMEIPALSVEAADVEPGSVAPVNSTLRGKSAEAEAKRGDKDEAKQRAGRNSPGKQPAEELEAWAKRTGSVIGVPPRALLAYGRAEVATREAQPDCQVTWATLAGIGRVESNHGQYAGAVLRDNGRPSKPIIGVPLDGSGVRAISDTDGGRLDGDTEVDRAVGPMQFIPSTWARWASDGNGDGKADPQQMDDAALSAARYLCASGRNMATAQGWWEGLWSYNRSVTYGQKVFGLADGYARALR